MSWEPDVEELERRRELARRMGGPENVERQHKAGRLTVRERIAELLDAGSLQRDRLARRQGHVRRRRDRELPARELRARHRPHRRPARRGVRRRLHRARRRGGRGDPRQAGVRRADGARAAHADRAPRRRHRRRRQREDVRGDRPHLRARQPGLGLHRRDAVGGARRRGSRSARWPGSAPRAWLTRTSR